MSATNKTSYLGLSSWLGSDKPQRTDFNSDNEKIDAFASEHTTDLQCHLSEEDREKFDLPYYYGVYFGNGEQKQTVVTNCPFRPISATAPVTVIWRLQRSVAACPAYPYPAAISWRLIRYRRWQRTSIQE